MKKIEIINFFKDFSDTSPYNNISVEKALDAKSVGLKIFEQPIVGISSAKDDLYSNLKNKDIIGENYLEPSQWLEGAKTVISFFNPFTDHIKKSNKDGDKPSNEWLHGRIEGQMYIQKAARALLDEIVRRGGKAVIPIEDNRFHIYMEPKIYSNWSERHAAYIAGLGTFSKNRALITEKGIAGRFGSIITDIDISPDAREYRGIYDNCIMCKACEVKCPVGAINKHGKSHIPCKKFLDEIKAEHPPWYGCGKCQAGMPCESENPRKKAGRNLKVDYSKIKNINNNN